MTRKIIATGIIALFIGLTATPVTSVAEADKTNTIKVTFFQPNGRVVTETLELNAHEIKILEEIVAYLQKSTNSDTPNIIPRFKEIIKALNFNYEISGIPIASVGQGKRLLPTYLPELKFEKLFMIWYYPTDLGATVIWGDGLFSPPTQFLQKKQIGFMLGFKGLLLYLPSWLTGIGDITLFLGTAVFIWGTTL